MKRSHLPALVMACVVLAPAPAAALDGWTFRVTPYLWLPTLSTETAIGNQPEADASVSVLQVLDFAALLAGEAHNGRYTILGEFNYLDLSQNSAGPGGLVRAETGLKGVLTSVMAGYAFASDERLRVETLAGVRLWSLNASVDFATLPEASTSETWVDPVVGLRATYGVTDRIAVQGLANIGGFGVGSAFQWEILARVGYAVSDRWTLAAGWRHLEVDVDRGRLDLEMTLTGPFLAADFTF
jgi:hypothetical protein